MAAPRILFLDHVAVLGGGELSLLEIAAHFRSHARVVLFEDGPFREALQDRGVRTRVLRPATSIAQVNRRGTLLSTATALPGLAHLVFQVAREARSADLLYANSQKSMVVAALAGAVARRPVVWHLRDLLRPEHFGWWTRTLAVTLANSLVTHVIANSEATRTAFVDAGGHPDRATVIHNGVNPSPFNDVEGTGSLRSDLGLPADVPLVGVFSRLAPWKGQHVLLHALDSLPEVHAVLVGDALFGPDQEYAQALHRLVREKGLTDRVHFLGFRDDVPTLMKQVDIVAHTSVDPEPFGRVIVEGMLAETPVVATAAGGAREIVHSGHNGLLVSPDDPASLRRALQRLVEAPDWARTLAERGRRTATTQFSHESMLEKIDKRLHKTASPSSSARSLFPTMLS